MIRPTSESVIVDTDPLEIDCMLLHASSINPSLTHRSKFGLCRHVELLCNGERDNKLKSACLMIYRIINTATDRTIETRQRQDVFTHVAA